MAKRILLALLLAAGSLLIAGWQSELIPAYGEICSKSADTGQKECATYHVALVALWHVGEFLNYYGVALTAVATVAIAAFTLTLWRATSGMLQAASDQSGAMERSIAEATRSAAAMEQVAVAIATNARTGADTLAAYKTQTRAYLAIITGGCVPQDRNTQWRYEVRMFVKNTGHTPAQAVSFGCKAQIFDFPLPANIDLTLPVERNEASGHIASGQQHYIRGWLDDLIGDDEIAEITKGNTRKLYVYGTVYYRDIFGEEHHTNFCQFGMWDLGGNFSTVNAFRHNDAT
jgi:hypothetical protein